MERLAAILGRVELASNHLLVSIKLKGLLFSQDSSSSLSQPRSLAGGISTSCQPLFLLADV